MYHLRSSLEDLVLSALAGLCFFIILPLALSMAGVNGLVVFITCSAGFMFSIYLISKFLHKQWVPHHEEWKKTINEMGLSEQDDSNPPTVTGVYRNHRATIYERIIEHPIGEDDSPSYETHYHVEFENPARMMLHIKRRSFYLVGTAPTPEFFAKKVHDIKVGDADFDGKFQVRGNDEALVRSILDSSFRDEMMRTRNILSPRRNIEVGYISPMPTPFPTWGGSSIPDLFRYREEYNIAHYIDPRKLSRVEEDAERIRAILDIMIYIVERIETNKPS